MKKAWEKARVIIVNIVFWAVLIALVQVCDNRIPDPPDDAHCVAIDPKHPCPY